MKSDNIIEKMMEMDNRKLTPKNEKVGDDLKDGEKEIERDTRRKEEWRGEQRRASERDPLNYE